MVNKKVYVAMQNKKPLLWGQVPKLSKKNGERAQFKFWSNDDVFFNCRVLYYCGVLNGGVLSAGTSVGFLYVFL